MYFTITLTLAILSILVVLYILVLPSLNGSLQTLIVFVSEYESCEYQVFSWFDLNLF